MSIRITAVPRQLAPNSGFHPMTFAIRKKNQVWAIPDQSEYIGQYSNIKFLLCDIKFLKKLFPIKIIRFFSLIEIFIRAIFSKEQMFYVHSFLFSLSVWAARKEFILVIHGSDSKYLKKAIGKFLVHRANKIYGVGFKAIVDGVKIDEIPNVFMPLDTSFEKHNNKNVYDILFVLRDAPVKNPSYPFLLFKNLPLEAGIKIGVIGLESKFLTPEEHIEISSSGNTNEIYYLGRCSFNNVERIMKKSKVFFLPSHSEGISKAMLEAMSAGLHVIASLELIVPNEFANYIKRVDLEDFESVLAKIKHCIEAGHSWENMNFSKNYLEKSIKTLDKFYNI